MPSPKKSKGSPKTMKAAVSKPKPAVKTVKKAPRKASAQAIQPPPVVMLKKTLSPTGIPPRSGSLRSPEPPPPVVLPPPLKPKEVLSPPPPPKAITPALKPAPVVASRPAAPKVSIPSVSKPAPPMAPRPSLPVLPKPAAGIPAAPRPPVVPPKTPAAVPQGVKPTSVPTRPAPIAPPRPASQAPVRGGPTPSVPPTRPVVAPPAQPPTPDTATVEATLKPLMLKVPLTVKELADKLSISPSDVIKRLLGMKILATMNQMMTEETIKTILPKYGYEFQRAPTFEEQLTAVEENEDQSKWISRPPVVTLMGHVDHGKTSLLDAIRETRVVEGEAGGITQHLGAYQVTLPKGTITFLDTPGHEAFTAMRSRGAHVTDIVILVIAADDGVMPQTEEAIDHAKAADATIVVALNKIDKPGSNPERVKQQLNQLGLIPEDWGGKTVIVPVSAKTGDGIEKLLEMVLLEAELLELKADPHKPAKGYVLEAELSKGKGPTARVLVQSGTLRVGEYLISGAYSGRVRAMLDEHGKRLEKAGPSTPAEVLGLSGVPKAGDPFFMVEDEKQARELVMGRQEVAQALRISPSRRVVTLEEFHQQLEAGNLKSLNLILKADVQGSLEALKDSLSKLSTDAVSVKFLHVGVGDVTDSDVLLAEASAAVVIAFHVGMTPEAQLRTKEEKVDVRLYQIIYEAVADIRAAMEGLLAPRLVEQLMGQAKVLQVFKVSKVGAVAGCQVIKGKVIRGLVGRVLRGKEMIHEGKISTLKRFKDDVKEVTEGMECGISLSGFNDYEPEDLIQAVEIQQVAQKL